MKLLFLGTSGYHPSERRHTSCLLLPECGVVLDAGTGMFRLGRYLQTDEVDIFLTHAHLDHSAGLTYLFSVLKEHPLKRLTIHGKASKLEDIQTHLFFESIFPVKPPWEFHFLDDRRKKKTSAERENPTVDLPHGGRLTYFSLEHPGGVLGFRLDWAEHSMAYVTDTTADPQAAYLQAIEGVDLLVHECYYPDAQADLARKYGHSSVSAVAELARKARVGKLVFTHIDPLCSVKEHFGLDVAQQIFLHTSVAEDLQEIEF